MTPQKTKKFPPGTRMARSLDKAEAERFASSPENRRLMGNLVVRAEKPPGGAPPKIKRIWSIYTE